MRRDDLSDADASAWETLLRRHHVAYRAYCGLLRAHPEIAAVIDEKDAAFDAITEFIARHPSKQLEAA